MVLLAGQMEENMWDNTLRTESKDSEYLLLRTEEFTKGNG